MWLCVPANLGEVGLNDVVQQLVEDVYPTNTGPRPSCHAIPGLKYFK